jgi:cardiolipin synthase
MERLKAGVEVRILNDFLGNIQYKKDQLRALRDAGAKWSSDQAQIGKLNYRNHRKITIIDGVIGHSGGVNIGQEYIDGGSKYPTWRDTGVRLTGPAVLRLQELFSERWFEVEKESLFADKYFPEWQGDPGSIMTQVVAHGVEDLWHSSARAYEIAIAQADKRVLIQSPYYVPTESMQEMLVNTALSGIEVHFMMTGWPDKKIAFNAAKTFWKPLLEAGAHVYLYDKGFFHAKSMVVDGQATAVGTMNMDTRDLVLKNLCCGSTTEFAG